MKLEYNIVGIAKQSEEDLRTVYDAMGTGVFSLALAVTKSRRLARELAVETFRRVVKYAPAFDTELNAQYWIADICMQLSKNSLHDPTVSGSALTKELVDNASALVRDTLFELSGDRGVMLTLKATTELGNSDIAALNGYYAASVRGELRQGLARLAELDKTRDKKQLLRELRADLTRICPDYYGQILGGEKTQVAHVSHEALYLPDEVGAFAGGAAETDNVAAREAERKRRKKRALLTTAAVVGAVLVLAGIVTGIVIGARRRGEEHNDPISGVQYGNTVNMVKLGGRLFFRGPDSGIYSYSPGDNGGQAQKIYAGTARELITDGTKLIFRGERSKIFSINPDGTGLTQLCTRSGTTLAYSGGRIYFSGSDGIYSMPAAGVSDDEELVPVYLEEVEDAPSRNCMVVTDGGRVVFSGGADKGIYEVADFNGSAVLNLLYFDEAYYITLWNGKLLFDGLDATGIRLYLMDLDLRKTAQIGLKYGVDDDGNTDYASGTGTPVLSYSAAYSAYGDQLWYEGYVLAEETGLTGTVEVKKDIGIYVIGANSDAPRLMLPLPEEGLHATELFADNGTLYCYFSDGRAGGARRLAAYDMNNFENVTVIFEGNAAG